MATTKSFTGPRARLVLDGTTIGYCTGISVSETIEYAPVEPIDTITTQEHAEVAYRVNGTLDFIRIVESPISKNKAFPHPNDLIGGQVPLTMLVQDGPTEQVVLTVMGFKAESRNFRVEGRTLSGENVSFVGQVALDEFQALTPLNNLGG